jgi:hypothetical protein
MTTVDSDKVVCGGIHAMTVAVQRLTCKMLIELKFFINENILYVRNVTF